MSTEALDNMWQPQPSPSPPGAEQRARLIREMAGSKRGRSSLGSGSGSGDGGSEDGLPRGGDWGVGVAGDTVVADAALLGAALTIAPNLTIQSDTNSQHFTTAPPEPDFQINTSALRRAFPDFSDHPSSTEDSVEVGRGDRRGARNGSLRNPPSEDISEALPFSFGKGTKYRLIGTPPIRPRTSINAKTDATANKENNPPQMEKRAASGSSGKASFDSHKTLVNKHATVESDDSVVLQEARPSTLNSQTRNARVASTRNKPNSTVARQQSQQQPAQNHTNNSALGDAPGTNQSYVIPDMPNITELITGRREDGTPIFNRSAKSRSRFTTPANRRASIKPAHAPVENVPVPAETKALYVSLQLLQEKVADLEDSKGQTERKLEEYELENLQLKSKVEEFEHAKHHSDSGLGSDAEEGKAKGLEKEKSKLETSLKTLQERLDRANRKVNKSEAQVSNLTKDRDALQAQLGIAYLHSQENGDEGSQALTNELSKLRKELSRVTRDHQKRINQLTQQETELRGKIDRREKAVNEMASLAKELYSTRSALAASSKPAATHAEADPSVRFEQTQRPAASHQRKTSAPAAPSRQRPTSRQSMSRQNRRQQMRTDHIEAQDPGAEFSDAESTTHINLGHRSRREQDLAKDNDFMSFMDGDEIEKLRTVVDEDRARLAKLGGQIEQNNETIGQRGMPSKSSMKKITYEDLTGQSLGHGEKTNTTRNFPEPQQNTQQSALSQTSERRRRSADPRSEMTSAFLVPDVTLTPRKSVANPQDVEKQTIRRPVPVSDRMPDETDATIRPARDPAVALASVIKNLEDELARFRNQLAEQEALYHQHDPSLSKRKRKIVYSRIQKLLTAIETRSDQIYALYDVLEGQKASGQMMAEEEVEVTLQNLGLDAEAAMAKKTTRKTVLDDDEGSEHLPSDAEESEVEFPEWEGMEPTQTQTLDRFGRLSAP